MTTAEPEEPSVRLRRALLPLLMLVVIAVFSPFRMDLLVLLLLVNTVLLGFTVIQAAFALGLGLIIEEIIIYSGAAVVRCRIGSILLTIRQFPTTAGLRFPAGGEDAVVLQRRFKLDEEHSARISFVLRPGADDARDSAEDATLPRRGSIQSLSLPSALVFFWAPTLTMLALGAALLGVPQTIHLARAVPA